MRARTVPQPLASLIAIGAKKLDCWPWPTSYRGLIAIHAASRLSQHGHEFSLWPPIHKVLAGAGLADPEALPLGEIVGIVNVTETRQLHLADLASIPAWERQLGDYKVGSWLVSFGGDVHRAPRPIPAVGQRGLWEWHLPSDVAPWWQAAAAGVP